MSNTTLGREISNGKPIVMTFYDTLQDVPFTSTFYVRDDEPDHRSEDLIKAVQEVSLCVLGKYRIGFQEFVVADARNKLAEITPYAIGGQKWVIKRRLADERLRSFTIPGRDVTLSIGAQRGGGRGKKGHRPDSKLPEWEYLVTLFREMCVSKEGDELVGEVLLDYKNEAWHPKGYARRR